jgi:hypothetical protein
MIDSAALPIFKGSRGAGRSLLGGGAVAIAEKKAGSTPLPRLSMPQFEFP